MKPVIAITLAGTVVAVVGLIAWLIVTDRDPTLLIAALPTVIPLLANLFLSGKIDKQTNGANAELRETNTRQSIEIRQLRAQLTPKQNEAVPVVPVIPVPVEDAVRPHVP